MAEVERSKETLDALVKLSHRISSSLALDSKEATVLAILIEEFIESKMADVTEAICEEIAGRRELSDGYHLFPSRQV
jgi:hypothetical protein